MAEISFADNGENGKEPGTDSTPMNEQLRASDEPNLVKASTEVTGKDTHYNESGGGGTPAPARENDGAGRPEGSTSETPQGTGSGAPPAGGVVIATDSRDKPHPEQEPEGGIPTPAGEPQGVLNQETERKGEVRTSDREAGLDQSFKGEVAPRDKKHEYEQEQEGSSEQ